MMEGALTCVAKYTQQIITRLCIVAHSIILFAAKVKLKGKRRKGGEATEEVVHEEEDDKLQLPKISLDE